MRRLDIAVLRAVLPRLPCEILRDAVEDEIAKRTHGIAAKVFGHQLRRLERDTSEDRDWDAHALGPGPDPAARAAILALVPDAGERVLALARAERDPGARAALASTLGRLGHAPAVPELIALLDDPYRHVRIQAAQALGALRAGEAADALRRMLATERGRPEPPHPEERIPVLDDDDAEAEARAALLAVSSAGTSG